MDQEKRPKPGMLWFMMPHVQKHESALYLNNINRRQIFPCWCHLAKVQEGEKDYRSPQTYLDDEEASPLGRRPSSPRRTLGNNGAGDEWWSWLRPLDMPINLDEVPAAPSQIFPSAYFVKRLPPLLSLPWKTSHCIIPLRFFCVVFFFPPAPRPADDASLVGGFIDANMYE